MSLTSIYITDESLTNSHLHLYHDICKLVIRSACDGICDGKLPVPGARVATAVLQCDVAEIGGVVVFPKADVVIRPQKRSALFVTYLGTDGLMDEGFVERSECPVLEGAKFQAVIHMRNDVSAQHDWKHFEALHQQGGVSGSAAVGVDGGLSDDFYED